MLSHTIYHSEKMKEMIFYVKLYDILYPEIIYIGV